jgi:hypothetical protein
MSVRQNATFGLVNPGSRRVLVTCHHIWAGFNQFRNEHSQGKMAILLGGNYPVELQPNQLVDADESLDLATFDMAPLLRHCSNRAFYPLQAPKATAPSPGDVLAFLGYPGASRTVSQAGVLFKYAAFGISVSDVSRPLIMADLTKTETLYDDGTPPKLQLKSHGGISGSPCFQLCGKNFLRLVALVTSEALGIVRLTRTGCLAADGTIVRPK